MPATPCFAAPLAAACAGDPAPEQPAVLPQHSSARRRSTPHPASMTPATATTTARAVEVDPTYAARAVAALRHGGARQARRSAAATSTDPPPRRFIRIRRENVIAGYSHLSEAFPAGGIPRRTAPTCLNAGANRMGIAAFLFAASKYKVVSVR